MNKETYKEINQHISEALEQWADILLRAQFDGWEYHMNYSGRDLLNAMYIFNTIWGNHAIKSGALTHDNALYKMEKLRETIRETFGIDSVELTKKILNEQ